MSETSLPPYSPELFLSDLKEKEDKSIDEALSFMMDVVNYVLLRSIPEGQKIVDLIDPKEWTSEMIFGFAMAFWFAQRDGLQFSKFLDEATVVLKERHPEMDVDHDLGAYRRIPAAHEASMGDILRGTGIGNQGTF